MNKKIVMNEGGDTMTRRRLDYDRNMKQCVPTTTVITMLPI